jgi:predicted MFS family arabinose efflux permease
LALAGLAALAVAMGVGRFAFTPLLPMMQEDAGLTIQTGGWLAAANYAGYLAGALWMMTLRVRAGMAIRCGLAAIGVLTLAMGLTQSLAAWLVLRFLAGVASALVLVYVSSSVFERLAARGRQDLGGVVFTGVGSGITLAGLVCLVLMQAQASSAQAWLLLGGLSLLLLAASWIFFSDENQAGAVHAQDSSQPWPAGSPRYIACYGAYGMGYIIPATFLPAMAKEIVAEPAVFGWAWPVFGIAAAAVTLATSALAARRPLALWIGCHLVMAVGVALPALIGGLVPIMIAAVCVGGTFVAITLAAVQEARRVAGTGARPLIAAMTAAFAAGQVAGPLIGVALGITHSLIAASILLVASGAWLAKRAHAP